MKLYSLHDVLVEPARRRFIRLMAAGVALLGSGRNTVAKSRQAQPQPTSAALLPGDYEQALEQALGGQTWRTSESIRMEIPQLAENGAIVPITVESLLPGTRRILLLAEKNPGPLLAEFQFEDGADAFVSLRVKLNESGPVLALAESEGKWFGAAADVKVMVGGCG